VKNKKTKSLIIILFLVGQVLLISCTTVKGEPNLDDVEDSNINNQVRAKVSEFMNPLKTTEVIFFEIQSHTANTMVFKNNFSVRIFKITDGEWEEIKEKPTTRLPEDDIVFSPDKNMVQIFAVHPDLDDSTHNVYLRFYMIGNMETDQGITKVAAYADVALHP
jgi:hypothetical protein